MKKIRIFIWADAVTQTGFSRVMHSIVEYLPKDKYDITWLGINYWGDPHEFNIRIYPAPSKGETYGLNRVQELVEHFKPDIFFILNDIWILTEFVQLLKEEIYKGKELPPIVGYFPIDAKDHNPKWYKNIKDFVPVVYNNFGLSIAQKASPDTKFRIIGHGVDVKSFYRLGEDKTELRKALFGERESHHSPDTFVFLNANRNQPRKKLDITMRGFAMFAKNKPETVNLYMHCGIVDASIDLFQMARRYDMEKRLIVSGYSTGPQQATIAKLNEIYNACDVGVNTSLGEGFGLVNAEHAVTGAPQVVPGHSACTELYEDCGVLIPVRQPWVIDGIATTGGLVIAEDVAKKMDEIYTDKALYSDLSSKSIAKFTSKEFSWEHIATQWDELFDEVLNANNVADRH
jgi:D-inositol-3-phosphate glycosyltransferase